MLNLYGRPILLETLLNCQTLLTIQINQRYQTLLNMQPGGVSITRSRKMEYHRLKFIKLTCQLKQTLSLTLYLKYITKIRTWMLKIQYILFFLPYQTFHIKNLKILYIYIVLIFHGVNLGSVQIICIYVYTWFHIYIMKMLLFEVTDILSYSYYETVTQIAILG